MGGRSAVIPPPPAPSAVKGEEILLALRTRVVPNGIDLPPRRGEGICSRYPEAYEGALTAGLFLMTP
jgi:hypothetical protein